MKFLVTGYIILLIAILINMIADYLNLFTWYKFLNSIIEFDLKSIITRMNIWDFLFLFIIYPVLLSLAYLLGEKIYNFII